MYGGPRQNLFDARSNPLGGFILGAPDRFNDLLDVCHLDVLYRQVSDSGVGVGFQRCRPLCGVLRGLPARFMAADEFCRALLEGFAQGLLCLLVVTLGQRVNAVIQLVASSKEMRCTGPSPMTRVLLFRVTLPLESVPHSRAMNWPAWPERHASLARTASG